MSEDKAETKTVDKEDEYQNATNDLLRDFIQGKLPTKKLSRPDDKVIAEKGPKNLIAEKGTNELKRENKLIEKYFIAKIIPAGEDVDFDEIDQAIKQHLKQQNLQRISIGKGKYSAAPRDVYIRCQSLQKWSLQSKLLEVNGTTVKFREIFRKNKERGPKHKGLFVNGFKSNSTYSRVYEFLSQYGKIMKLSLFSRFVAVYYESSASVLNLLKAQEKECLSYPGLDGSCKLVVEKIFWGPDEKSPYSPDVQVPGVQPPHKTKGKEVLEVWVNKNEIPEKYRKDLQFHLGKYGRIDRVTMKPPNEEYPSNSPKIFSFSFAGDSEKAVEAAMKGGEFFLNSERCEVLRSYAEMEDNPPTLPQHTSTPAETQTPTQSTLEANEEAESEGKVEINSGKKNFNSGEKKIKSEKAEVKSEALISSNCIRISSTTHLIKSQVNEYFSSIGDVVNIDLFGNFGVVTFKDPYTTTKVLECKDESIVGDKSIQTSRLFIDRLEIPQKYSKFTLFCEIPEDSKWPDIYDVFRAFGKIFSVRWEFGFLKVTYESMETVKDVLRAQEKKKIQVDEQEISVFRECYEDGVDRGFLTADFEIDEPDIKSCHNVVIYTQDIRRNIRNYSKLLALPSSDMILESFKDLTLERNPFVNGFDVASRYDIFDEKGLREEDIENIFKTSNLPRSLNVSMSRAHIFRDINSKVEPE